MTQITREIAQKVLNTVDAGLTKGIGESIPGQMCVEAAVCFALGLPHGDEPDCVAPSLRTLKIRLNDLGWSCNQARAKGLRELALLQLGSKKNLDEVEFVKRVAMLVVNKYLPPILRKVNLEVEADACGQAANLADTCTAAYAAAYAAYAAAAKGLTIATCRAAAAAASDAVAAASADAAAAAAAASAAAYDTAAAAAAADTASSAASAGCCCCFFCFCF